MSDDLADHPADHTGTTGRLQDVVDELAEFLKAPAVLEDTDFTLLAYCSQGLDVDPVRTASILGKTASAQVKAYFEEHGIRTATGPVRVPGDPERQIAPRACLPVRHADQTLGYLWVLEPEGGIDLARLALAVPLATRAGELLARRRRGVLEQERLIDEVLSEDARLAARARTALLSRGELLPDAPMAVVVLRAPAVGPCSGPARTLVVSLPPNDPADPLAPVRRAARRLGPHGRAGISGPTQVLGELPAGRRRADWASRVALGRPRLASVLSWDELGFYQVVGQGAAAVEALIAGTPAARLRDRAEAELVRTALVYLDEAGQAARAAAVLSVHRQTLYYRLEKIEQLCGIDLDQGEARLQLHLGLALGEVLPYLR